MVQALNQRKSQRIWIKLDLKRNQRSLKKEKMSDQEILKQRDLLDAILASRTTSQYERLESMKVMDSIYFKENLPENVVLFPLQRIKRYVHTTTRKPSKKSL